MKFIIIFGAGLLSGAAFGQGFTETFDDLTTNFGSSNVTGLISRGWVIENMSSSVGPTSWYAGNNNYLAPDQNSASNLINPGSNVGYIAADENNTNADGRIADYLITPETTLHNGDTLTFETASDGLAPNRLDVWLSTNGASTKTTDFTSELTSINPNLMAHGYPTGWSLYTITISGLNSTGLSGRIAFEYDVTNGGYVGQNSSYIGLDNVKYAAVPEPMSIVVMGGGLLALACKRRK